MNSFKKGSASVNQRQQAFTLIELLVVVAIIGILAAVVIAAMNKARGRGNDAAVKTQLKSVLSQAELYYYNNGNSYSGVCATSGSYVVGGLVNTAEKDYDGTATTYANGTASTWSTGQCHDSAGAYAVIVPLSTSASGSSVSWCVDSTSAARQVANVLANSGATQYACPAN